MYNEEQHREEEQEEPRSQAALELSRDEQRRRTNAQSEEDDCNTNLRLQEEELAMHSTSARFRGKHRQSWLGRMLGQLFHAVAPPGRVCDGCHRRIHGDGVVFNGSLYHPECHTAHGRQACTVCHQSLPTRGKCVSWCEHPFWQEKFCDFHNEDGTPRCASCERLKSIGARWIILSDGREICVDCSQTMIADTPHCQPLYDDVLGLYRQLQLELPARPPLMLVDRQALNERSPSYGHGGTSQTRGMTLAEEYRTIRSVYQRPQFIFGQAMGSYPVEHRECRVTAILILFGLPRLLTGSILAHECMHAYLKLAKRTDLMPIVEEGLCQLMAYLWVDRQLPQGPFETRLASFIANQIRTHPSPIYGDGFRMALASFQCYGLPDLINHVKLTGLFPEPHPNQDPKLP